jgi:hypothetical protein
MLSFSLELGARMVRAYDGADHSIDTESSLSKRRGEVAATAGRLVDNARSRRAVCPTPCARPGDRSD